MKSKQAHKARLPAVAITLFAPLGLWCGAQDLSASLSLNGFENPFFRAGILRWMRATKYFDLRFCDTY
jgi:hypothetical protein